VKLLQDQLTSVGRLRIGIRRDALLAKEAFHVGYFKPRVFSIDASRGSGIDSTPFSPDIHMFANYWQHRSDRSSL
jgi:hypothetical protein